MAGRSPGPSLPGHRCASEVGAGAHRLQKGERWQHGGTRRRAERDRVSSQGVFGHAPWRGRRALLRALRALIKQIMLFEYVSMCEGPEL